MALTDEEIAALRVPLEDPEYQYLTQPTPREIEKSRALLAIPGRFSVQMLADILAGAREEGGRIERKRQKLREAAETDPPAMKRFIDWWHPLGQGHDCGMVLAKDVADVRFSNPATQEAWERFIDNGFQPFDAL